MSQKTRKTVISEDKEKKQTDGPVKEMKKKMAANAEKEKQAAEKADKPTEKAVEKQTEKNTDKQTEKSDKNVVKADKNVEKSDKNVVKADKNVEKSDKNAEKSDKNAEKPDKNVAAEKKTEKADKNAEKSDTNVVADKKTEKIVEKKEPQTEKSKDEGNKEDKSGKSEKSDQKKADSKVKQNGREPRVHNGVSDVTLSANGAADDVLNGTVSAESEDDDVVLVIDDQDQDDLFPELTYDDGSDVECFEPPTPENAPSRSFTRRSQVKATRTPETPRPASDKLADKDMDDPKDSKVLKMKEDAPPTDRKLRSADSPKPETKKDSKKQESPKKSHEEKEDGKTQENAPEAGNTGIQEEPANRDKVEMEVVVEVETEAEPRGKADTNYSKSRVKVSPYRRSARAADQTNTSVIANYTGNNTTMEMDITETSSFISDEAVSLDDSPYLRGLRSIRGRTSYKPLKEMTLRHVNANRSTRSTTTLNASDAHSRPTGTVVGRKRKPDSELDSTAPALAGEPAPAPAPAPACELSDAHAHSKRARLLDRLAVPFRRTSGARNAEIVGINTDLPLTAPVVSAESFDPESLKSAVPTPEAPIAVPLPTPEERDTKRCIVM